MAKRGDNLRGKRHPNAGRKKGQVNKATAFNREFIQRLLDNNTDRIEAALRKVLEKDPKTGVRLAADLAEYCTPKLARTEVAMTLRRELRDFTDDEILQILIERNAQRAPKGETGTAVPRPVSH